jgi:hypothetical protein
MYRAQAASAGQQNTNSDPALKYNFPPQGSTYNQAMPIIQAAYAQNEGMLNSQSLQRA